MGAFVVHVGATVLCSHGGQAQATVPSTRVRVNGQFAVTQMAGHVVSGCALPTQSGGPCVSAQWITAALRVQSGGQPLLLQNSQATCAPPGTPLNVTVTQTRVSAT
jgi:hypothetical protein